MYHTYFCMNVNWVYREILHTKFKNLVIPVYKTPGEIKAGLTKQCLWILINLYPKPSLLKKRLKENSFQSNLYLYRSFWMWNYRNTAHCNKAGLNLILKTKYQIVFKLLGEYSTSKQHMCVYQAALYWTKSLVHQGWRFKLSR